MTESTPIEGHVIYGLTWAETQAERDRWAAAEIKRVLCPFGPPVAGSMSMSEVVSRFILRESGNTTELLDHGKAVAWFKVTSEFPKATFTIKAGGGTFTCHSNCHALGLPKDKKEQHCAGALIFAEKQGAATQMMRVAERLRMYDRDKLMAESNQKAVDVVFDSLADFTKAQETA